MWLNSVEDELDKFVYGGMIVCVHLCCMAVGYDHAAGHGMVAEERGQAGKSRGFHLKVADAESLVFELLDFGVLVGVLYLEAELASLGTIESTAGDGDAACHILACYLFDEFGVCLGYVGGSLEG